MAYNYLANSMGKPYAKHFTCIFPSSSHDNTVHKCYYSHEIQEEKNISESSKNHKHIRFYDDDFVGSSCIQFKEDMMKNIL